jgi:hypothetical protein
VHKNDVENLTLLKKKEVHAIREKKNHLINKFDLNNNMLVESQVKNKFRQK